MVERDANDERAEREGSTIGRRTVLRTGAAVGLGAGASGRSVARTDGGRDADARDDDAVERDGSGDREGESDCGDGPAQSVFDFGDAPVGDGSVAGLLDRNRAWTETLNDDYFADVQESQDPNAVSVCCSDSRVAQSPMFASIVETGSLFTPSNIGNKAVAEVDGETVVDGNFGYALAHLDVETAAVVGHTDCGAITAAYRVATGDLDLATEPPGVRAEVEPLVPIAEAGLADDAVDADDSTPADRVVNQLVEYNVHRQVALLEETGELPEDVTACGFVYDFVGAYSNVPGRTALVNLGGVTDPDAIREELPDRHASAVGTLLE